MSKFKVGDKVRCVDNCNYYDHLTEGKVYVVLEKSNGGYVRIKPDRDLDVGGYCEYRFELVQESTTTTQATAKRKDDDLFTPDCLVGVETNYGYITNVLSVSFGSTEHFNPSLYVYTTESLSEEDLKDVHNLKYYISDESDETVSFTDYVNMFYDGVY